jgi:hypothetical protein
MSKRRNPGKGSFARCVEAMPRRARSSNLWPFGPSELDVRTIGEDLAGLHLCVCKSGPFRLEKAIMQCVKLFGRCRWAAPCRIVFSVFGVGGGSDQQDPARTNSQVANLSTAGDNQPFTALTVDREYQGCGCGVHTLDCIRAGMVSLYGNVLITVPRKAL